MKRNLENSREDPTVLNQQQLRYSVVFLNPTRQEILLYHQKCIYIAVLVVSGESSSSWDDPIIILGGECVALSVYPIYRLSLPCLTNHGLQAASWPLFHRQLWKIH